jgi:hypothetical protein
MGTGGDGKEAKLPGPGKLKGGIGDFTAISFSFLKSLDTSRISHQINNAGFLFHGKVDGRSAKMHGE